MNKDTQYFIIGLITIVCIILGGTYGFILYTDSSMIDISETTSNTPTWHKINDFNGVSSDTITVNTQENKIRVVSTAMLILNYADSSLITTLQQGNSTLNKTELYWNSKSVVASKSQTIEFSGLGHFKILVNAYELQWWTIEVYGYY